MRFLALSVMLLAVGYPAIVLAANSDSRHWLMSLAQHLAAVGQLSQATASVYVGMVVNLVRVYVEERQAVWKRVRQHLLIPTTHVSLDFVVAEMRSLGPKCRLLSPALGDILMPYELLHKGNDHAIFGHVVRLMARNIVGAFERTLNEVRTPKGLRHIYLHWWLPLRAHLVIDHGSTKDSGAAGNSLPIDALTNDPLVKRLLMAQALEEVAEIMQGHLGDSLASTLKAAFHIDLQAMPNMAAMLGALEATLRFGVGKTRTGQKLTLERVLKRTRQLLLFNELIMQANGQLNGRSLLAGFDAALRLFELKRQLQWQTDDFVPTWPETLHLLSDPALSIEHKFAVCRVLRDGQSWHPGFASSLDLLITGIPPEMLKTILLLWVDGHTADAVRQLFFLALQGPNSATQLIQTALWILNMNDKASEGDHALSDFLNESLQELQHSSDLEDVGQKEELARAIVNVVLDGDNFGALLPSPNDRCMARRALWQAAMIYLGRQHLHLRSQFQQLQDTLQTEPMGDGYDQAELVRVAAHALNVSTSLLRRVASANLQWQLHALVGIEDQEGHDNYEYGDYQIEDPVVGRSQSMRKALDELDYVTDLSKAQLDVYLSTTHFLLGERSSLISSDSDEPRSQSFEDNEDDRPAETDADNCSSKA